MLGNLSFILTLASSGKVRALCPFAAIIIIMSKFWCNYFVIVLIVSFVALSCYLCGHDRLLATRMILYEPNSILLCRPKAISQYLIAEYICGYCDKEWQIKKFQPVAIVRRSNSKQQNIWLYHFRTYLKKLKLSTSRWVVVFFRLWNSSATSLAQCN